MFVRLWTLYIDSLISHPLLTKCCTSAIGFMIGDSIAQILSREPHSLSRTVRFAAIGFFLHAPVADAWFTLLEGVRIHHQNCRPLYVCDLHMLYVNCFQHMPNLSLSQCWICCDRPFCQTIRPGKLQNASLLFACMWHPVAFARDYVAGVHS